MVVCQTGCKVRTFQPANASGIWDEMFFYVRGAVASWFGGSAHTSTGLSMSGDAIRWFGIYFEHELEMGRKSNQPKSNVLTGWLLDKPCSISRSPPLLLPVLLLRQRHSGDVLVEVNWLWQFLPFVLLAFFCPQVQHLHKHTEGHC